MIWLLVGLAVAVGVGLVGVWIVGGELLRLLRAYWDVHD